MRDGPVIQKFIQTNLWSQTSHEPPKALQQELLKRWVTLQMNEDRARRPITPRGSIRTPFKLYEG